MNLKPRTVYIIAWLLAFKDVILGGLLWHDARLISIAYFALAAWWVWIAASLRSKYDEI